MPKHRTIEAEGGAQAPAAPASARARKRARSKVLRGHRQTLAELVSAREPNPPSAIFVLAYLVAWGVYVEAHEGQWPRSSRDLARFSEVPESTMLRWQERFRVIFPEYSSPKELWAEVRDQVEVRGGNAAALTLSIGSTVVTT